MKRRKEFSVCLTVLISMLLTSCEYYLGLNQQPDFKDKDMVEGLNIFGLLRPDNKENYNKSFIYVQKMWPVLNMDSFTIIHNVDVHLEHIVNGDITDSMVFPLVPSDSLFPDTLYRPLEYFMPQPGERYRLVCRYSGLTDAVGETVFPPQPVIVNNSLMVNENTITFSLAADSLIKMFDIYLVAPRHSPLLERLVPDDQLTTDVELNLQVDPHGAELKIFGYDASMASYCGNANTSLNFNKYRTTISTLESGYGVFGSLNYTVLKIP
jgi:hypothetical protein